MTIKGASRLHQEIFDAIEARDVETLDELMNRHHERIVAEFPSWRTAPQAVRDDPDAVARYGKSLIAIAQVFDSAGEPVLMQMLTGPDETNPVVQWQRGLAHAQALSEAGEYADSNERLEEIVAAMATMSGSGVVNLRPMVLGTLGTNALRTRDYDAALNYTRQAYDASLAAQDEEGCETYYENMMALHAIRAHRIDPQRGQALLRLRHTIARAQASTDAGRYQASLDKLAEVAAILERHEDELVRALAPKVHGLLGFNEWKLGNVAKARELNAAALRESEARGDLAGVRVYTANLQTIDGSRRGRFKRQQETR